MAVSINHRNMSRIKVKKFEPVVIKLTKSINKNTALKFVDKLHEAERTGQPFVPVFIHCSGGDVYASFDMVEAMERCSIPIYTVVTSYAASAAALIFACGSRRFMGPRARLLLHDVWTQIGGTTTSDIKEETREMRNLNREGFAVMARHAGRPADYFLNKLKKRRNQDVYVHADKALKWGIATDRGVPWVQITYNVDMEMKDGENAPLVVAHDFSSDTSDSSDTDSSSKSKGSDGSDDESTDESSDEDEITTRHAKRRRR